MGITYGLLQLYLIKILFIQAGLEMVEDKKVWLILENMEPKKYTGLREIKFEPLSGQMTDIIIVSFKVKNVK